MIQRFKRNQLKRNRNILVVAAVVLIAVVSVLVVSKTNNSKEDKRIQRISQKEAYDIVFGDPELENNFIVYFDYNCMYCKRFMSDIYPEIDKKYIASGKMKMTLRLVCRPSDVKATEAYQTAMCLFQFGDYMKLHKLLMHKNEIIYTDYFQQIREEYIAVNEELAECILSSENIGVKNNIYQFQQLETKGTPTFVIGTRIVKGFKNFDFFDQVIRQQFN
jgi:protein-disulfide isomerase